uniref:tRNA(Ile)-lysidine synthase n=1 Tax=Wildemania schizophylla TaxID=1134705 RepID=A0A126G325_WILSC|nr:hypothetical protein [Wildemania schizophylla]AKS28528.1 hypothetical protein [Wildemania schizophylla]
MVSNSLLHTRFFSTVDTKHLLPANSSLLVAFSGGQDSLTLVKILYDFKRSRNWRISLIHFDHRWRTDSMSASEAVFTYAKSCSFPLYYFECPIYLKSEEESRKWRYMTLLQTACSNGFNKVLLAHTSTDRAETLLNNLFRGSGLDGLSSIAWSSKITTSVDLVRPLLNFCRSETGWFCRKYCLPVWVDHSNYNYSVSRNRLRQELIPYVKSYFQPNFEEKCSVLSSLITLDADFLEQESLRIYSYIQHKDLVAINLSVLQLLHPSIQTRILKLFLLSNLNLNPNAKQINDMMIFIRQSILTNINIRNFILGNDGTWLYAGVIKI